MPTEPSASALRAALLPLEAALGGRARIVGGHVRDLLLGRERGPDIDVVVEGVDAGVAAGWLRRHWGRPEPVVTFERFGTAQLACRTPPGGMIVEFVRARKEAYLPESRKPTVRAGTLDEDVWRRDFTVNTLLLDGLGVVTDVTGMGLQDCFAGRLRTPLAPLATLAEDPLRMLRAARFASQLGFDLDADLLQAMVQARDRIGIVSPERVRDELGKLLLAPTPSTGLRLLQTTGLLAAVAPELEAMVGVEQSGYHVGDVFTHTLLAVDAAPPDRLVRLATLLHDVGKPATAQWADGRWTFHGHAQVGARLALELGRRLRLPHREAEAVARLVALHMRPIQYQPEWDTRAVRRLRHDAGALLPALLAVARADTMGSRYPSLADLDDLATRLETAAAELPLPVRSPLDGTQLKLRFGLADGPWIGRAQSRLVDAVVDGGVAPGDTVAAEAHLRADRQAWEPRPGERGATPASGPA
ncbi:MAG TPA: HD domain-containing protein [Verrucomicrobiae bacterium]|nr:HD domain-containing protein [Verrucomicrobiae bacterium]